LIGGAVLYLPQCLLNSRAQGREILHGRAAAEVGATATAQVSWLSDQFPALRDAAAVVLGGQGGVLVSLFEAAWSSARSAGLSTLLAAFVGLWGISTYLGDVSVVDSLWSLGTFPCLSWGATWCVHDNLRWVSCRPAGFLLLTWVYNQHPDTATGFAGRKELILGGVALWAVRLAGYITWRNHGQGEGMRTSVCRECAHGRTA
jgi:steroid 5-alpha reductase family enzyme